MSILQIDHGRLDSEMRANTSAENYKTAAYTCRGSVPNWTRGDVEVRDVYRNVAFPSIMSTGCNDEICSQ